MPEVRLAIPSVVEAALLPRLIGTGRARWLVLTGEAIDAGEALDWGLVERVVAPEALDAAVDAALDCDPRFERRRPALAEAALPDVGRGAARREHPREHRRILARVRIGRAGARDCAVPGRPPQALAAAGAISRPNRPDERRDDREHGRIVRSESIGASSTTQRRPRAR
jgi:enoyl-CoA hydratase/carnithine racemase